MGCCMLTVSRALESLVNGMKVSALTVGAARDDHRLAVILNATAIRPRDSHRLEVVANNLSVRSSIQHSLRWRRWS